MSSHNQKSYARMLTFSIKKDFSCLGLKGLILLKVEHTAVIWFFKSVLDAKLILMGRSCVAKITLKAL